MDKPVIFKGELIEAAEAVVPMSSEVALRGAAVFEGIRGYDIGSGVRLVPGIKAHLRRLFNSAEMLGIAHEFDEQYFERSLRQLLECQPGDVYLRPSIAIVGGRNPNDPEYLAADYSSVAAVQRRDLFLPATAIIASGRKMEGDLLPSAAKAGGSYLQFRLPSIERARSGRDHVIVLNADGRVAEAEGAAVIVVRNGEILSPPPSEGALPSITWKLVREMAEYLGFGTQEVPVERSALISSEAVFLAGTLCELVPLELIDSHEVATSTHPIYDALARQFDKLRIGQWMPRQLDLSRVTS